MISRQTWQLDVLILIGLCLLGYGLWLRFGESALAIYAGTAMVTIGVILASAKGTAK